MNNWHELYIAETGKVELLEKQLEAEQKKTQRFNDLDNINNYKKSNQ